MSTSRSILIWFVDGDDDDDDDLLSIHCGFEP
jgi:hypothetical protein